MRHPIDDIIHSEKYRDIYSLRIILRGPESQETFECPLLFDGDSFRDEIDTKNPETIKFMLLEALKNCWKELKK
jgi:hypothetical protein